MASNFFERAIEFISPKLAYQRAKSRFASGIIRSYEGASKGRRTDDWRTTGADANAEIRPAIHTLRNRAREQDRNNAFARKAINVIANNTIGQGIRLALNLTDEVKKKKFLEAWNAWADYTHCDHDERLNFYGQQRLAMRSVALSGDLIVIKKIIGNAKKGVVPLQIQLLEGDYLDYFKETEILKGGGKIMRGIEYDKNGKRVAYWLFDRHPGDFMGTSLQASRYLAKDILHVFLKDRPGQESGVPFGTSGMILLKDYKDYQDAELVRQKIATCFALFVKKDNIAGDSDARSDGDIPDKIEPGAIQYLTPGEEVTYGAPPSTSGYSEHARRILQAVAASYGITYEALTGDLSNVNFSSGRMGWLEMHRQITDWQNNMMIPQFCDKVFQWFLEAGQIAGYFKEDITAQWTPPRREMIDPVKEIKGMKEQIRNGLISYQEAVRELGYDPDNLLAELTSDMNKVKKFGLVLDCDPRNDIMPKADGVSGAA